MKANNIKTLDQLKDKYFGEKGTHERNELEAGYKAFEIGAMIHDARIEKGLTQEQLAEKCGTTKSNISKIENNVREVRISTLQKIIERGFNGHLQISLKF